MSCNHSHGHSHGDGHPPPPIPTNPSQSLNSFISTSQLNALNLNNETSLLPLLFKSYEQRYSVNPIFTADDDLIIHIPFTSPVKIYSVILRTANGAAKNIAFYKNQPGLDFESVGSLKATYKAEHPHVGLDKGQVDQLAANNVDSFEDDDTFVEHHLPRRLFSGVETFTLYFKDLWDDYDDDEVVLFSIEIRGEWTGLKRDPVVAIYEASAQLGDHKKVKENISNNVLM